MYIYLIIRLKQELFTAIYNKAIFKFKAEFLCNFIFFFDCCRVVYMTIYVNLSCRSIPCQPSGLEYQVFNSCILGKLIYSAEPYFTSDSKSLLAIHIALARDIYGIIVTQDYIGNPALDYTFYIYRLGFYCVVIVPVVHYCSIEECILTKASCGFNKFIYCFNFIAKLILAGIENCSHYLHHVCKTRNNGIYINMVAVIQSKAAHLILTYGKERVLASALPCNPHLFCICLA